MAATWGGTTVLTQEPDVVWAFLTDEANDVNWREPWVRDVRRPTSEPIAVGTRYETIYRFFGQRQSVVVEIMELVPPLRMAWRQVDEPTIESNFGSYDLEAVPGGGTRFTVTGTFESRGWRRLIDAPFAWYLRNGPVQRQHRQLAAALANVSSAARSGGA